MFVTIFAGGDAPFTISLENYNSDIVTFGRSGENNIVLSQRIVSYMHGHFVRYGNDWVIVDDDSSNGLVVNEERIKQRLLSDGLKIYIGSEQHTERVLFICSTVSMDGAYQHYSLHNTDSIVIGRDPSCGICLGHTSVTLRHAAIRRGTEGFFLRPIAGSVIRFNGKFILSGEVLLKDMNRFMIGNTQFLYNQGEIIYYQYKDGMSLEVSHLVKTVKAGRRTKNIVDDVSLQIQPGEFVAIIGGSGAGKTSLMKCISGCMGITSGSVLIQGEDISTGYNSVKSLIGYVPQQDIVYDNLTLERMLYYSACLRMPKDVSKADINNRIKEIIAMVELTGHEKTMIRKLSGGQKKRASIAVELLSNPGILFLDEPTSGLDPGTEYKMMLMLKNMTEKGKTIILVTHATLNINLCDRIIFMAAGGKLAFSGAPEEANKFFGVQSIVDVYNIVQNAPGECAARFAQVQTEFPQVRSIEKQKETKPKVSALRQMRILIKRYCEMIVNDGKKLGIMIGMPLILGLVMLAAAWDDSLVPFKYSADTQTFALAIACCCFFLGLFQSFQEISKERTIVEREKMADMKCRAYFASKLLVLAVMLLLQTLLLFGFSWLFVVQRPEHGVLFENQPFLEFYITTYLTALSAAIIGLAVSAAARNSEQTLYVMPLLLMMQILFAEVICALEGAAKYVSYIVSCRWACLAYCGSAKINELYERAEETYDTLAGVETELEQNFINARYEFMEKYSVFSVHNPTMRGWVWLLALCVIFSIAAVLFLKKKREL